MPPNASTNAQVKARLSLVAFSWLFGFLFSAFSTFGFVTRDESELPREHFEKLASFQILLGIPVAMIRDNIRWHLRKRDGDCVRVSDDRGEKRKPTDERRRNPALGSGLWR